jgi:hypothetical protein
VVTWDSFSCATIATARLQYKVHFEWRDTQSPLNTANCIVSQERNTART